MRNSKQGQWEILIKIEGFSRACNSDHSNNTRSTFCSGFWYCVTRGKIFALASIMASSSGSIIWWSGREECVGRKTVLIGAEEVLQENGNCGSSLLLSFSAQLFGSFSDWSVPHSALGCLAQGLENCDTTGSKLSVAATRTCSTETKKRLTNHAERSPLQDGPPVIIERPGFELPGPPTQTMIIYHSMEIFWSLEGDQLSSSD